jgi:hypothetical protein
MPRVNAPIYGVPTKNFSKMRKSKIRKIGTESFRVGTKQKRSGIIVNAAGLML